VPEENLSNDNRPQKQYQTSSTFEVATQQQTLEVCAQNQMASVVGRRKLHCSSQERPLLYTTVTNKKAIYNSGYDSAVERRRKALKTNEAGRAWSTATAVPCLAELLPKPERHDLSGEELKRTLQDQDQSPPKYSNQSVTVRDKTNHSSSFADRFAELRAFKRKFGHYNVTQSKAASNKPYLSLGRWCSEVRISGRLIKQGKPSKLKLTKANIELLETTGFQWGEVKNPFDKRIEELTAFKAKFGHCNTTRSTSASNLPYLSLGRWCSQIRHFRRTTEEGKPSKVQLSKAQIESLDALGFRWGELKSPFDRRFEELKAFKEKFGHCDVSKSKADKNKPYVSLGGWCSQVRRYSRKSAEEGNPSILKLTKDQIEMLNSIGFRWEKLSDQSAGENK
jgi:hypothetical protein